MNAAFEFTSEQTQRLPVHIAKTTELLRTQSNPRLCLWFSFEITEMVLKWVFAVSSSGIYHANGELTERLLKVIRDAIKVPTLGGWQAMARAATKELRKFDEKTETILPFADFFHEHDIKHQRELSVWDHIKDTRNRVIHGGGLTENQATKIWTDLKPDIISILTSLSELHDSFDVWARFASQTYNLEGTEAPQQECPHSLPEGDGTWLIDAKGWPCPLQPLLVYEPVMETWEIEPVRHEERDIRKPVPQSYFKLEKGQLFYTPIGVDDNISINSDLRLFNRIFAAQSTPLQTTIYDRQLASMRAKHVVRFQGRVNELKAITKWRTRQIPDGNRIGLVVGEPGFGKSALIANAAWTLQESIDASKTVNMRSIAHAFSAEDPLNGRRNFLLNLLQQLEDWLSRKRSAARASDQAGELETKCIRLLNEIFSKFPENHLTLFVDGLDEIAPIDSKFPQLLLSLLRPRVTIIASTRKVGFVKGFEADKHVDRIFFDGGQDTLPGMSDKEVRAMLLEGLGSRAQEIISLDEDDPSGAIVRNAYIERIVERADGKPLYVELLIVDIVEFKVRIDPDARLPASVERYYEQLLSRQGLSDTKSHLSLILCLLALAKEPLSRATIIDLFMRSPGTAVSWDIAAAWVKNALDQGGVFVRSADGFSGQQSFVIYHQELKRFLLGSEGQGAPQLRWAFGLARWILASASADPLLARENETRSHFQRFGFEYLLDHADHLRPKILDGTSSEFTEINWATSQQLTTALTAWQHDREAFLNSFARIFKTLRGVETPSKQDELLHRLMLFALEETALEINSNIVHAVYGYSEATLPLFHTLIAIALSEDFLMDVNLSSAGRVEVANWNIKAGNMQRRKGNLAQASEMFETAERQLVAIKDGEANVIAKMRALLLYEMGYVAYQSSDGPRTDALFTESARFAREAGDSNGEAIAESVRIDRKSRFSLASGKNVTETLDEAERYLTQAMQAFSQTAQFAEKEEDRLTAERWVLNCKSHLFNTAFHRGENQLAQQRYEELIADKWLQKDEKVRETTISNHRRRIAYLRGEIDLAIAEYEASLPVITNAESSDAFVEAAAQNYLEFAQILIDSDKPEKAKIWLRSGLLTSDEMANGIWKPKLQELLDQIA